MGAATATASSFSPSSSFVAAVLGSSLSECELVDVAGVDAAADPVGELGDVEVVVVVILVRAGMAMAVWGLGGDVRMLEGLDFFSFRGMSECWLWVLCPSFFSFLLFLLLLLSFERKRDCWLLVMVLLALLALVFCAVISR